MIAYIRVRPIQQRIQSTASLLLLLHELERFCVRPKETIHSRIPSANQNSKSAGSPQRRSCQRLAPKGEARTARHSKWPADWQSGCRREPSSIAPPLELSFPTCLPWCGTVPPVRHACYPDAKYPTERPLNARQALVMSSSLRSIQGRKSAEVEHTVLEKTSERPGPSDPVHTDPFNMFHVHTAALLPCVSHNRAAVRRLTNVIIHLLAAIQPR